MKSVLNKEKRFASIVLIVILAFVPFSMYVCMMEGKEKIAFGLLILNTLNCINMYWNCLRIYINHDKQHETY